jgi:hypothetical protein
MTNNSSQFPRDRILWILANSGGKIERSILRKRMAMKYSDLDPILAKLARERRIRIDARDMVSLK